MKRTTFAIVLGIALLVSILAGLKCCKLDGMISASPPGEGRGAVASAIGEAYLLAWIAGAVGMLSAAAWLNVYFKELKGPRIAFFAVVVIAGFAGWHLFSHGRDYIKALDEIGVQTMQESVSNEPIPSEWLFYNNDFWRHPVNALSVFRYTGNFLGAKAWMLAGAQAILLLGTFLCFKETRPKSP